MLLLRSTTKRTLDAVTSDIICRIQRLESEYDRLRARIESDHQLRFLAMNVTAAAHAASLIGEAIERFARGLRVPIPRGRAGGLARARSAWRYFDGTFMPESEKVEAFHSEYERYAAGGRARAAEASRASDGAFLPTRALTKISDLEHSAMIRSHQKPRSF